MAREAARRRAALGTATVAHLVALAVFALALEARASIAVPLSLEDVLARAELVVEGRVSRVTNRTRAVRGRTSVERGVLVEVSATHRGPNLSEVHFTLPGGRIGDRERVVVGAPTVRPHEEIIAFLAPRGEGYALVGLAQGLYRIERHRDGRAFAVRDLRDLAVLRGRSIDHGERESMPLEAFREKLQRALEEPR